MYEKISELNSEQQKTALKSLANTRIREIKCPNNKKRFKTSYVLSLPILRQRYDDKLVFQSDHVRIWKNGYRTWIYIYTRGNTNLNWNLIDRYQKCCEDDC